MHHHRPYCHPLLPHWICIIINLIMGAIISKNGYTAYQWYLHWYLLLRWIPRWSYYVHLYHLHTPVVVVHLIQILRVFSIYLMMMTTIVLRLLARSIGSRELLDFDNVLPLVYMWVCLKEEGTSCINR